MIDLGDWKTLLAPLFSDERYKHIRAFLIEEYRSHVVYPDMYDIYNCFRYTPFANVKAVLLGQDPYHNEGQANGLCFSVREGIPKPPSLENMFKELQADKEKKDDIVYFGPMGCRTGFYLLTLRLTYEEVLALLKECIPAALALDEIPGSGRRECGNYLEHDLAGAKQELAAYLAVLEAL